MLVYASAADYTDYTGQADLPADIDRRLERASERIDELLLTAYYRTDDTGMPTEPAVREAVRRATCAQAAWTSAHGDEYGVASAFKDVAIGSVKLSRGGSNEGGTSRHAPDAHSILRSAGLLPGFVMDTGGWW
ncbi:hypothetical protein ACIBH1_45120 [Nonomuraea sp. NPDC050663]|uniref:hypothetical protein n=1 Tax=Nonomuraea sp. NPDC050663 TaxID=3364370 RepID=UPI0037A8953E